MATASFIDLYGWLTVRMLSRRPRMVLHYRVSHWQSIAIVTVVRTTETNNWCGYIRSFFEIQWLQFVWRLYHRLCFGFGFGDRFISIYAHSCLHTSRFRCTTRSILFLLDTNCLAKRHSKVASQRAVSSAQCDHPKARDVAKRRPRSTEDTAPKPTGATRGSGARLC